MPQPELDATVNGVAANSYADLGEAEAYFATRRNSSLWAALADNNAKKLVLMDATRRLEEERYAGTRTTETQALKWGRSDVVDEDGTIVDRETIPTTLKKALFEQAIYMLSLGTTDMNLPTGLEPFKMLKTTTVTLEMDTTRSKVDTVGLAPATIRLLGSWIVTYDVAGADISPGTFRTRRV